MAAVFALVFLFVIASSGLMFKSMSSGVGTMVIWALFIALAGGVFVVQARPQMGGRGADWRLDAAYSCLDAVSRITKWQCAQVPSSSP